MLFFSVMKLLKPVRGWCDSSEFPVQTTPPSMINASDWDYGKIIKEEGGRKMLLSNNFPQRSGGAESAEKDLFVSRPVSQDLSGQESTENFDISCPAVVQPVAKPSLSSLILLLLS